MGKEKDAAEKHMEDLFKTFDIKPGIEREKEEKRQDVEFIKVDGRITI